MYEQGLDADHKCLDKNLLKDLDNKSRFIIDPKEFQFKFKLVLPSGLTCKRCVFQVYLYIIEIYFSQFLKFFLFKWKYHSGNRYGIDPITKEGGRGLGIQEEFYGCSDVTIVGSSATTNKNKYSTTTYKRTTTQPTTTTTTTVEIIDEEQVTEEIITDELLTEEVITEELLTEEITTEEMPTTTRSNNLCLKDGYFPDVSKDCTEYFICQNSGTNSVKITRVKCPNGLKFNKQLNICDWPSVTKCS